VIYGGDFTGSVVFAGTTGADSLTGTAAAENFVGGQGGDMLVGGGGADAFQGGEGDDTIAVATLDFFLADGGNGTDTLRLDGAGLTLDLTTLADNRTRSIEQIDITGTGDNSLTLSVLDVLNISDESNELLVKGDAGDTAMIGAGWTKATTGGSNGDGTSTIDGQTYQIYAAAQASLLVDTDVSTVVPGGLSSIDLATLTPDQGSVIYGAEAGDLLGYSVGSAGDVNGDGFDDLIIGARSADAAGNAKNVAGESYVIFGTSAGLGVSLDLAALAPSQGFVIYGADAYDYSGIFGEFDGGRERRRLW
jgi:hypothetical protein